MFYLIYLYVRCIYIYVFLKFKNFYLIVLLCKFIYDVCVSVCVGTGKPGMHVEVRGQVSGDVSLLPRWL